MSLSFTCLPVERTLLVVDCQEDGEAILYYLLSMLALVPNMEMRVERCIILIESVECIGFRSVEANGHVNMTRDK